MSAQALPRLSAHSLKEFDRCQRKFALAYLQHTFWPGTAPDAHDSAAQLALGQAFHMLVQVHALGQDVSATAAALADPDGRLATLWQAFERSPHAHPPAEARIFTEQQLHFFLGGVPFFVRYDRLVSHEGAWTILDWKTGRVDAASMAGDWQTRLYRFALVEAGAGLGLGAIKPQDVQLIYWEVATGTPVPLPYSVKAYEADRQAFTERAARVLQPFNPRLADDPTYPRSPQHCKSCSYDSLCNRITPSQAIEAATIRAPRFVGGD